MTVNLTPPPRTQVLIGEDNQDWSRCFLEFQIGDPEVGLDGLLPQRGTLKLVLMPDAPESMNPRSSTGRIRFARGQRVIINVADSNGVLRRHPRGWAYIATPPLPPYPEDQCLSIELVCCLDLQKFPQPPGRVAMPSYPPDPSTAIPKLDRNGLILTCFQKAGLTNSVSVSIPKYPVVQPVFHDSGDGYIAYAGQIAFGGMACLWQDNQGTVRSPSLAMSAAEPITTVVIGRDEVIYEPRNGGEKPCEKIIFKGDVQRLKTNDDGDGQTPPNDDGEEKEVIDYGPAAMVDGRLGTSTIVVRITKTRDGKSPTYKWTRITVRECGGIISKDAFPMDISLRESSNTLIESFYDPTYKNILKTVETVRQPFCRLCATYFNNLDETERAAIAATPVQQTTTTVYSYDGLGRQVRVEKTVYLPVAAIAPDEEYNDPTERNPAESEVITYREIRKDEWEYRRVGYKPNAIVAPNAEYEGEADQRIAEKLAFRKYLEETASANNGTTKPPATDHAPNRWETEPKPIEGYAEFEVVNLGFSPRERSYQLDTLCTGAAQLIEAAQIQGARLIGRAQGAYLEIPLLDAFFDRPEPLQTIAVVETEVFSNGTRQNLVLYQMDGLGFYLDGTESKVLMNLVWLGTTEGSLIPHSEPSIIPNFQANLIRPPYIGLTLNQSNQSLPSQSPELVILTPSKLTIYGDFGIGCGLEAEVAPVTTAIAQTAQLGLGIGLLGITNEPILGQFGIGVGMEGVLQVGDTLASLGLGLGLQSATESVNTLQIGLGLGIDAALLGEWRSELGIGLGTQTFIIDDAIAQIGLGIGIDGDINQPLIGELGLGFGLQSSAVDDTIAQLGVGLGADATINPEMTAHIGLGLGMDSVIPSNFEPEFDTLIAALSGTYDSTRRTAMNAFIAGLKTNNLWSTIAALKLYPADVQADTLVNWKNPGTFNSTIVGSPTFIRDRGFGGFSTSNYLFSGFTPSTAGSTTYTQNSATFGVYNTGQGQSDAADAGAQNNTATTTAIRLVIRSTNNATTSRINTLNDTASSASSSATAGTYTSVGWFSVSRTASNANRVYRNGANITNGGTNTVVSTALPRNAITTGAVLIDGASPSASSNRQFVAEVIASGWSDADHATFYSLLNTYLQSIKKASWTFTRVSDGDTNDVFYWLGTNGYSQAWANPAPDSNPSTPSNYTNNAHIFITASSIGSGSAPLSGLCDRGTTNFFTNDVADSWVKFDLGPGRALSCPNYSIRNYTNTSGDYLRNWNLEGSNDDTSWTAVDVRTNNTTFTAANTWGNFTCNQGVTTAFRYWRIRQTGLNSSSRNFLCFGEFAPYGTLTLSDVTTLPLGAFGDQSDIFYYLGRTASPLSWTNAWVNPAASGVVTVTASAVDPAGGNISMLTDRTRSDFYTTNVANSWVQFDFGSRTVRLDAYHLRNYISGTTDNLRSWRVRGSNDGSTWTDLDIRSNDTTLSAPNVWGSFTCNQGNTSFWRYIRIEQTGPNSSSRSYLCLGEVRLGGAIA